MSIVIGIIGILLGFLMVYKPAWFLSMIGEQKWAEKVFGIGHGTTAYQVIGIIIIFLSFLIMTGMIKGIILSIFGPIMGGGL